MDDWKEGIAMKERHVRMDGQPVALAGRELRVGETAPDFTLRDQDLGVRGLEEFGSQVKLISTVVSLDTDLCDQQTRQLNEEVEAMPNTVAITVSADLPFAQKRWCGAAGLHDAVTLSDHYDVRFGRDYGVLIPKLRLLSRALFVLDGGNTIVYREYVPEVSQHPDYQQVIKVVRGLQ